MPDPRKVEALKNYPERLENVKQVRGFLGLVGYYRQLIEGFNEKAKPLHDLLSEKTSLVWRPKHSRAVKELKDALINVTMTSIFSPDLPLVLKTDASKYAVGAVLEQEGYPIAFESRKKSGREVFYPAYESELMAIVYALSKWKLFIGTELVTIERDHATLSRMLTQKKVTTRLGYWLDKLADFNFRGVYKPGKQNIVADALSRRPDYMEVISSLTESRPERNRRNKERVRSKLVEWGKGYESCDDFREIVKTCKTLGIDEGTGKFIPLIQEEKEFHWDDGLLWVKMREGWKMCVPTREIRREVLQGFHDDALAGHPGIEKTILDIERIFWWPALKTDVEGYVRSCPACALAKASFSKYGGLLHPLPTPKYPWEVINTDLIMGLPKGKDGFDAIVTFVCQLTKMAHLVPEQQSINASELGEVLWVEVLPMLEFAYNSTVRSSTKVSPFEMLYGFTPEKPVCRKYGLPMQAPAANLPLQAEVVLRRARRELDKPKLNQQRFANAHRRDVEFKVGDKVWLKVSHLPMATSSSSRSLSLRYRGPFKIIGRVGKRAYKLKLLPSMLMHPVFHVSLLKPWMKDTSSLRGSSSPQVAIGDKNENEVQGIFKHQDDPSTGRRWFKVF
ncbi:retrotransposon ty3-gypsy subclass [Cystoisospora suis]|uniref:Retrotransposon ty3-gypsy subclass n=1 Tax=Cystoisospora suis TaxID=483139 RepID=A0A2C6L7L5_9APIC|nr:retrotransposon ty3-gypsy subclass [Cystoisospora suis]